MEFPSQGMRKSSKFIYNYLSNNLLNYRTFFYFHDIKAVYKTMLTYVELKNNSRKN